MEKEKHTAYRTEVPGADTVVLFVHGILGTPDHFDRLVEMVPGEYSIYNVLLTGHGGTVDDFADSTMKQWKAQVHRIVKQLSSRYSHIYMVAHSMGTLFAINESFSNTKIEKLFLLNVPTRPYLHPRLIRPMLAVAFDKIADDDEYAKGIKEAYSIAPDRNVLKYLRWIPNYLSLFAEVIKTVGVLDEVDVPMYVLQSGRDELVLKSAYKDLDAAYLKKGWLPASGHFFYEQKDMEKIERCFEMFLQEKAGKI